MGFFDAEERMMLGTREQKHLRDVKTAGGA
jgi:hypothetical protein